MFFVYILESRQIARWYIGFSTDLKARFKKHNDGLVPSTKPYKPWKLIYYEVCTNEQDARRREHYLKTTQGRRMLKLRLKEYLYQSV